MTYVVCPSCGRWNFERIAHFDHCPLCTDGVSLMSLFASRCEPAAWYWEVPASSVLANARNSAARYCMGVDVAVTTPTPTPTQYRFPGVFYDDSTGEYARLP